MRRAAVVLLLLVPGPLRAQGYVFVPRIQPELHAEAVVARRFSALVMGGANTPLGMYVRAGAAVGVGGAGRGTLRLEAGDEPVRGLLIGGEPLGEPIVMWWNFVGRSHDEIVEARDAWEAGSARFGHVVDHGDERVPAPPLPAVRLTPRRRRA